MKSIPQFLLMFLMMISLSHCKEFQTSKSLETEALVIHSFEVNKKELVLNQLEGKWYFQDKPFNGYSLKYHANGTVEERLGFYEGKREGIAKRWSKQGVLRVESYYKQNRLVGTYKSWWENGVLGSEAHYVDGKKHGAERTWYPSGQLAKERQLINDIEDGIQKGWLENGKLYVNYESKNGRIFGMRRANSCYKLENEVITTRQRN